MAYVIGTTEWTVRFCVFSNPFDKSTVRDARGHLPCRLVDRLDLGEVSVFDDKATATSFAEDAGLSAWRCIEIRV